MLGAFNDGGAGQNSLQRSSDLDLSESLAFSQHQNAFQVGFEVERDSRYDLDLTNSAGTFTFSSLAAYTAGTPIEFTERVGDAPLNFAQYQLAGFVTDDIRLMTNLSLSMGVRYETQTRLNDRLMFAPRIGFAWSPFTSGKTTVRGGFGIYPQWLDSTLYQQVRLLNGDNQSNLIILQPGYPNPYATGTINTSVLPPSIYTPDPRLRMPYLWRTSASVRQQLGGRLVSFQMFLCSAVLTSSGPRISMPRFLESGCRTLALARFGTSNLVPIPSFIVGTSDCSPRRQQAHILVCNLFIWAFS